MTNVGPNVSQSSHKVSFVDDKGNEYGLKLKKQIRRIPQTPFTMQVSGGGTRFGEWDPTFTSVEQSTWLDGRGHEFRDIKRSGYWDSRNAWTLTEGYVLPSMQHRWATGAWYETYEYLANDRSLSWQPLWGDTTRYVSNIFTTTSSYDANKIYFWIRRVGNPSDLTYAIFTDDGSDDPNAVVASASGTVDTDTITDYISEWYGVDVSAASNLTTATKYHVVIYGASADNTNNHWEVGVDTSGSASQTSGAGSTWAAASFTVFHRVIHLPIKRKWLFFVLEKALYAVDVNDDESASQVLINGDRGIATGTPTTTTIDDSTKSWIADEWIGAWVYIHKGVAKGKYSQITDNTTNKLTFNAIAVTPDDTSEYFIYSTDKWTEIDHGADLTTVKSVDVLNNIMRFAQGAGDKVVKGQWNADTPVHDFSDDGTVVGDVIFASSDTVAGPVWWVAENSASTLKRANATGYANFTQGSAIDIGADDEDILYMTSYDKALYVMKGSHPWKVANNRANPFLPQLAHISSPTQGVGAIEHGVFFFIPWAGFALERFYGSSLDDIGDKELPDERVGHYASMTSHPGGLIAAIDADAGTSHISVYEDSRLGWHEIFRAHEAGARIRSLFWQDCPGTRPRLWFDIGGDVMCMEFPKRFNPIRDTSVNYHHEAVIESSTIDMQAASLYKYFHDMTLRTQNLTSDVKVILEYKLDADVEDTSVEWVQVGEFLQSPKQELKIRRGEVTKIRLRLRLQTNSKTTPPAIEAWNLEGFSRTPLKDQFTFSGVTKSFQMTKAGTEDADPADLAAFLRDSARKTRVLTMKSEYEDLNGIQVIMEPPSFLYDFVQGVLQRWGATYQFTAREA